MRFLLIILTVFLVAPAGAAEADRDDFNKYLQGRFIFKSQCVPCHGTTGRGNGPWAKGMPVQPRNFRMGIFKYRSTPMSFQPTDDDLRRTITRGVSGTAMPTFAKTLSDRDLTAVVVYLKNLSTRWKDDARRTNAFTLPPEPTWFFNETVREKHARKGRPLFDQICVNCHGPNGAGNGPGAASLTNVWGHAAVPANLGLKHHRSGPKRSDLFRTIAMGLDGTPMIGFRDALKEEQIWDLIAVIEQFAEK
ncbi:MAG: c-type cytochrome [Limisphaerales bacterium]